MTSDQHPVQQVELMAFLDGELPSERAAAVAVHLTQCGECRVAVAESRDLAERLSAWQVEPAPASLTEHVNAAASGEVKPSAKEVLAPLRRRLPLFAIPRWAWAAAGGGCIIFIIFAAIFFQTLQRPGAPTEEFGGGLQQGVREGVGLPPPAAARVSAVASLPASQGMMPAVAKAEGQGGGGTSAPGVSGPMIARTAALKLLTKDFDKTREALEVVVRRHRGYSAQLTVGTEAGSPPSLTASFKVPADQLDATIAEIKQLAHVEQESQGGEEVTDQYADLQARLSNARRTEQTLLDILQKRTGQLADVLAVEQELSSVRERIERMEAELKGLENRVAFATLQVELREEYKAQLEIPNSLGGRLRNTLVEGFRTATDSLVGVVMFLLSVGPFLLLWALILFLPARYLWRRVRARQSK